MSNDRVVVEITGKDAWRLLQDLVTNDLGKLDQGMVYSALLTPQGKYLFDFFMIRHSGAILLDVQAAQAAALVPRLNMYKLRADVTIKTTDLVVSRGLGDAPEKSWQDPRHRALGWRCIGKTKVESKGPVDWTALRVAHCVPQAGVELISNESYILECGFERLNGVDFKKGCYVGQEVTARMKHKTELRKGLATVAVKGQAPVGTGILAGGKSVGVLYSQSGGQGIAYLRFARALGEMQAEDAVVSRL